jgi:hypothetical protein
VPNWLHVLEVVMSEHQSPLPHSNTHSSAAQSNRHPDLLGQSAGLHLRHSAFLPAATTPQPTEPTAESREPVQLMVIGSAQGIEAIIQNLHLRGFAHINEWSLAMPHSSGRLMRVLTRWVQQKS